MNTDTATRLLTQVEQIISARSLNHFAEEAKVNGESLRDAMERYEIDYAWHILGSARLRDETIAALEDRLQHKASETQVAEVIQLLQAAAATQAPELLMSFDNDVPAALTELLCASWMKH